MIKKVYMASASNDADCAHCGPYDTVHEAEAAMERMGWRWVLVSCRMHDDETGRLLGLTARYYQPCLENSALDGVIDGRHTTYMRRVIALQDKLLKMHESVTPLSTEEKAFFAPYEAQLKKKRK